MKTIKKLKSVLLLAAALLVLSCNSYKGSASDTTGTNGATNRTGKVFK
jgi:predicted small secreted protein